MNLSEFKQHLDKLSAIQFIQPDGNFIPAHFHITEAGLTTKHFIDCGGTVRVHKTANFQVWVANDTAHRLAPQKLKKIIAIAEPLFGAEDLEVEIEYQIGTIGRFGLGFNGHEFLLTVTQTDCLAKSECATPEKQRALTVIAMQTDDAACCTPGGGCC